MSLTGTAHRRTTYFQLPEFWDTTPKDEWPDHFMWKKFFRQKGLKAATHPEMSALQFPTSAGRETTNQEMRLEELAKWNTFISQTNSRSHLEKLVNEATTKSVVDLSMISINLTAERDHILASNSWQITKGLRKIRSIFRTS